MTIRDDIAQTLPFITGRAKSHFSQDLHAHQGELSERVAGARVLTIGAAGSIGSAYVKELLRYKPAKVVVIDTNENALTELVRDLRSTDQQFIPDEFITYPLSYSDPVATKIIDAHGPFDIVANFAAHKHVRSEKDIFSIEAMFENNVFRARDLLDRISQSPPQHFFCVSTDKAANPVNLMGASKKLMEHLLLAYAGKLPVSTARFANVAFSNGSLLDGFIERMRRGQPLSAPTDVRRYFVTPEESGQICLLSCLMGNTGEIFFPKLDADADMRSFSEIAEAFLRNQGLQARRCESEDEARALAATRSSTDTDYPVYFFESDTSGEKPFEEFYSDDETVDLKRFDGLGVVSGAAQDLRNVESIIASLRRCFVGANTSKAQLVEILSAQLPGFSHIETQKNLDQKM